MECDSSQASEDIGELEVCAVLTEGDLAIDVAVNLSTICGEACGKHNATSGRTLTEVKTNYRSADGEDFSQMSDAPLMFLAGSSINTTSCLLITIMNDFLVENDEDFSVSITSNDPVNISPTTSKTITILNDDCKRAS